MSTFVNANNTMHITSNLRNMFIDVAFDRINNHYRNKKQLSSHLLENKICKRLHEMFGPLPPSYVHNRLEFRNQQQKIFKALAEDKKNLVMQRSPEWFKMRENLISASDFHLAVGSLDKVTKGENKQLYKKKCGYESQDFTTAPAMLHGVKFESVACNIYSYQNNTKVTDFGLIQHPEHSFIGASPDGITSDGVMLEIKNPYSRIIHRGTGVPSEYYLQIQGQLEVCNLEECDYFECSFKFYKTTADFLSDKDDSNTYSKDLLEKGVIITYYDSKLQKTEYIYSDIYTTSNEKMEWVENTLNTYKKDSTKTVCNVEYWKKEYQNLIRVYRNKKEFEEIIFPRLNDVWSTILRYRNDKNSYMDEVVKTRTRRSNSNISIIDSQSSVGGDITPLSTSPQASSFMISLNMDEALANQNPTFELNPEEKKQLLKRMLQSSGMHSA